MPRQCSVCRHPERRNVDRALIEGHPFRGLAKRFTLSATALYRHREAHLSARLAKAHEARETVEAGTLLDQVGALQERVMAILATAEAAGDLRTALASIREARGNLELLVKLLITPPIDIPWSELTDRQLQRIAAGEDPAFVLRIVELEPMAKPAGRQAMGPT